MLFRIPEFSEFRMFTADMAGLEADHVGGEIWGAEMNIAWHRREFVQVCPRRGIAPFLKKDSPHARGRWMSMKMIQSGIKVDWFDGWNMLKSFRIGFDDGERVKYVKICEHMWKYVKICEHMWKYVKVQQLQPRFSYRGENSQRCNAYGVSIARQGTNWWPCALRCETWNGPWPDRPVLQIELDCIPCDTVEIRRIS